MDAAASNGTPYVPPADALFSHEAPADEEELTIIEYARFFGLATPYMSENPYAIAISEQNSADASSIDFPPSLPKASELKQELPLLRSNNEYDLKHFGKRVIPDLRRVNLPIEVANEDEGNGLSWPVRYRSLTEEKNTEVRREKLCVTKEVMPYFEDTWMDHRKYPDAASFEEETLQVKRVCAVTGYHRSMADDL